MGDGVRKRLKLPVGRFQLDGALNHPLLQFCVQGSDLPFSPQPIGGFPPEMLLRFLAAGLPDDEVQGKRDVRSHLPEQFDLLLVKKVLLVHIESQGTDYPLLLLQGDTC